MPQIYVSIGSNIQAEANVEAGLQGLRQAYGEIEVSPVYQTKAVGFAGDDFLNAVIGFHSVDDVTDIQQRLKQIEQDCGRERHSEKFTARTLDLDLLLYGDLIDRSRNIPRDEITRYAFVLKPLADLAPDAQHPELGRTYQALWQAADLAL